MASGNSTGVEVAEPLDVVLNGTDQIAFHDLHVVDVVEKFDARRIHFLHDAHPAYTPEEMERYVEAWSQPGAASGMINYYRSSVRQSQKKALEALRPINARTLVIWGERDRYLSPDLAEPDHDDVPNLDRVERLPDASHWVHHDAAERVNQLLTGFFAPAMAGSGGR